MTDQSKFDPEQGVSAADMNAAIRVAEAYMAAQSDYPQYEQTFNESTGVWEPIRCSYVRSSDFLGVDEFGDGIFEDRDRDKGEIPSDFITTPRAQWVAAWEAKQQVKVDEFTAVRDAAEIKERARTEQAMRETHLQQLAKDRALQRAITDPGSFTPRDTIASGCRVAPAESREAWQARAVKIALAEQ